MPGYKSNPKEKEIDIAVKEVDKIINDVRFEEYNRPEYPNDRELFIFSKHGEEIEGRLISGPHANIRRNSTYRIERLDGSIVEIFANKLLHQIFKKKSLMHSWIRIVYLGRQKIGRGYARKIYRVYQDKGTITPKWQEKTAVDHIIIDKEKDDFEEVGETTNNSKMKGKSNG